MHMTAPEYRPDAAVLDFPVGRAGLVPRQLLPHGQHRSTLRRQIWNKQGVGLDVGLEA